MADDSGGEMSIPLPLPHEGRRIELQNGSAVIDFPDLLAIEIPKSLYYGDSRFYHSQALVIAAGDLVWLYLAKGDATAKMLNSLGFTQ